MIATSGFLTALECTKFDLSRGSAPDPAEEAYSALQTPGWFKGPTSKGRGGKETGKEGRGGMGGRGRRGERGRREEVFEGQKTGKIEGKGYGCQGKGREWEGKGGKRRGGGEKAKEKSKNTPSVNSCLRNWSQLTANRLSVVSYEPVPTLPNIGSTKNTENKLRCN